MQILFHSLKMPKLIPSINGGIGRKWDKSLDNLILKLQ